MNPNPIALVFALQEEIKPILAESKILTRISAKPTVISKAEFRGSPLIFCQTGIGALNAQRGFEQLLLHSRPRLIVSTGYAGAANPTLKTGDLVIPSEIRTETNKRFEIDSELRKNLARSFLEDRIDFQTGPLLTVRQMAKKGEKERAGTLGNLLVDMETAAVAEVAIKEKIPFLSLRVVFDTIEQDIPFEATPGERGPLRFLIQNRRSILKIPQFFRMNQICQRKLAGALSKIISAPEGRKQEPRSEPRLESSKSRQE